MTMSNQYFYCIQITNDDDWFNWKKKKSDCKANITHVNHAYYLRINI